VCITLWTYLKGDDYYRTWRWQKKSSTTTLGNGDPVFIYWKTKESAPKENLKQNDIYMWKKTCKKSSITIILFITNKNRIHVVHFGTSKPIVLIHLLRTPPPSQRSRKSNNERRRPYAEFSLLFGLLLCTATSYVPHHPPKDRESQIMRGAALMLNSRFYLGSSYVPQLQLVSLWICIILRSYALRKKDKHSSNSNRALKGLLDRPL